MLKADQKNAGCISVGFIVIYQDCDTIKEKEAFFIMQLYYIDKHQIQEKLLWISKNQSMHAMTHCSKMCLFTGPH